MLRNNETGVYTRPDAETYRQDFICKHGGVLFDPEKVKWISEEVFIMYLNSEASVTNL